MGCKYHLAVFLLQQRCVNIFEDPYRKSEALIAQHWLILVTGVRCRINGY